MSIATQVGAAEQVLPRRRLPQFIRWMIFPLLLIPLIAVPIHNQKFHQGSYSDNYSADFDVNRVEYPLLNGIALNRTAHEIYITYEGRPRITLWQMI